MSFMSQKTLRGYVLGEVASALQKSIRRSDEEQATWWAAELDQSGFGNYCWTRLQVICSEDVGLAWVEGPSVIGALKSWWDAAIARGNPSRSERLFVVHAAALLARAPKSRRMDHAVWATYGAREQRFPIPDYALDMHTARGRAMKRGEEHFEAEAALLVGEAELGADPYYAAYQAGDEDAFSKQGARAQVSGARPKQRAARLFSPGGE